MGLDGYQVFVRADDHDAVETAIRAYVARVGSDAVVDPDTDDVSGALAGRPDRQFVLSTVHDGVMCVWEDGGWADRRLAAVLSEALGTRAVWLMMSDSTDSWAYAVHEAGRELRREHLEPDDPLGDAEQFAREEHLPFALQYLDEPEREDPEFQAELERRGLTDHAAMSAELQEALRDSPEEAAALLAWSDDDEAEDEQPDESLEPADVDDVRHDFREFTVPVGAR